MISQVFYSGTTPVVSSLQICQITLHTDCSWVHEKIIEGFTPENARYLFCGSSAYFYKDVSNKFFQGFIEKILQDRVLFGNFSVEFFITSPKILKRFVRDFFCIIVSYILPEAAKIQPPGSDCGFGEILWNISGRNGWRIPERILREILKFGWKKSERKLLELS